MLPCRTNDTTSDIVTQSNVSVAPPSSQSGRSSIGINSSAATARSFLCQSFQPSKPRQCAFRNPSPHPPDSDVLRAGPRRNKGDRKSTVVLVYQLAA